MGERVRQVRMIIEPQSVTEGAGVKLRRSIATRSFDYLDPFLLFDHFGSDDPDDYMPGFPMHPHRGIETVTYLLAGEVRHEDSLGNHGVIGPGDVQWMTSGGGIMHEEMPNSSDDGRLEGFQLWVNLPAKDKMSAPRYQDFPAADVPIVSRGEGVSIRVIAGEVDGVRGPVEEIVAEPLYLDVTLAPKSKLSLPMAAEHAAFVYVFEGEGCFGPNDSNRCVRATRLAVLCEGEELLAHAGAEGARFLLLAGKPIGEPISRYGPFVMNTREEIEQAILDLRNGTFVYSEGD